MQAGWVGEWTPWDEYRQKGAAQTPRRILLKLAPGSGGGKRHAENPFS